MNLPADIERAIAASRARIRFGFPWWLRPWLFTGVAGITLGRTIYVRADAATHYSLARLLRHELAHVRQVDRLGLIPFLVRYCAEFVRHFLRVRSVSRAYALISFEVEARAAESQSELDPL